MTERQTINRLKELYSKNVSNLPEKITEQQIIESTERKKRWMSMWRNNINLYIHCKMGLYSYPFQHFSYYLMGISDYYNEVSTRAVSKTFRGIAFLTARCLLYPCSKVGVCAVTKGQASEDFQTTFLLEIVGRYSKYLKWLWDNKYITSKETDKGYMVSFWNGSVMYFFPCIDSSRGKLKVT